MNLAQYNLNSKETKMHKYSSQFKNEFIKKWVQGLHIYCSSSSNKKMNILERKRKIKLSADIALASAKKSATCWSRAIISNAKKEDQNTILVNNLLDPESKLMCTHQKFSCHMKRIRSKKILKKSFGFGKKVKKMDVQINGSNCIAKRLVKKRTQMLKKLVPGGESMDEYSIIKEALDYILSLKVQVDVMKNLVDATTN